MSAAHSSVMHVLPQYGYGRVIGELSSRPVGAPWVSHKASQGYAAGGKAIPVSYSYSSPQMFPYTRLMSLLMAKELKYLSQSLVSSIPRKIALYQLSLRCRA